MNRSSSTFGRIFKHSILSLSLCLGIAGCADMITYSQDAQTDGVKLYKQGDYADAAGAFRNSVRQDPRNYVSYYYLGASYEQMGQYQQAIASFKTARQTIAVSIPGKYDNDIRGKIFDGLASSIARSDERDQETDTAQRDAQDHQSPESWFLLAKIYAYRGDADSAIDSYNRAALLDPQNFTIAKDYGLYLERIGMNQRAETPLRRAYALNNQDDEVAAALRRIGVVPGPGLLDENQLAKPIIPRGPLPEVKLPGNNSSGGTDSTVSAPRD